MRIRAIRYVRYGLLTIAVLFLILNTHILMTFDPDYKAASWSQHRHWDTAETHMHSLNVLRDLRQQERNSILIKPRVSLPGDQQAITSNYTDIVAAIQHINYNQNIHNLQRFGLMLNSNSVVIVIQVHDRLNYLEILLKSLKNVKGIEDCLVIVSHDMYKHEINSVVQAIDFCPIMQIFLPKSVQLYPNVFPGDDPNDCPRNMKKNEAIKKNCNNALYPDHYGHYREARYSQTKHHWFWKLNRVFDGLKIMKDYDGLVLLLEEDYYVSPDAISVLKMMNNIRHSDYKDCDILSLGNYDKQQNYRDHSRKVEIGFWISSKHNLGMAFDRSLWNNIRTCAKEFCYFDDYNWDWTLQHLSMKCLPRRLKSIKMKATRVIHMGECGLHQKGKVCHPDVKREQVERVLASNNVYLFPNVLVQEGISSLKLRDPKPNGGWGDRRDRELCASFVNTTT